MTSIAPVPPPFDFTGSAFQLLARLQCETLGLMTRRAQAYLDLPRTLSQCHSPEDLLAEQVRFWQIAHRQYAESYGQAVAALPIMKHMAAQAPAATAPAAPRRDYMVVADRKTDPAQMQDRVSTTAETVPASRPTIRVRKSA